MPERGGGWYAVARHADVMVASRRPDLFLSGPGVTTPPPARWVRWLFGDSMVNLDDPRHAVLRRIVSRSFTPRLLARVERDTVEIAARIVSAVERERPVDFVSAVAAPLPFEVICSMMGVPRVQRERVLALVTAASEHTGVRRPVAARLRSPARGLRALAEMRRIIVALGRERRRRPGEDLVSALVSAEVDGRSLSGRELGAFFSLLLVAGVETTRNALAHGLWLLTEHPGQRERLCADLEGGLPGAVEEIVRFSSPIIQFRRAVAVDCELGGQLSL
ncbi:cytochrome P450, partial [Streptomyces durbertensis]|uniref:cytochrome P450 n=1 Tax=Streptomyces durbertensis TaxID=2448886 RepID=UPI002B1FBA10